jgi:hypothetical protein
MRTCLVPRQPGVAVDAWGIVMADEGEAPKPGHFLPGGAGAESCGPQPEPRTVIPSREVS